MRVLIATALLISTVSIITQAPAKLARGIQQDHQNNSSQPQDSKNKKQKAIPSTVQADSSNEDDGSGRTKNKTQDYKMTVVSIPEVGVKPSKDWVGWGMLVCTIILTLVGIVGTCAAIKTLKQIKRQADTLVEHAEHFDNLASAAATNAVAAKASADALMNSDRAWLLVDMVETKLTFLEAQWVAGCPSPIYFTYRIRNYGKTPAQIYSIMTRYDLDTSRDTPPRTDIYHAYTPEHYPWILPPGRKHIGSQHLNGAWLTGQQFNEVKNRAAFLWAYGVIFYRDVYGRDLHTRFCYRYEVPPFIPEGNEHFCLAGDRQWNTFT